MKREYKILIALILGMLVAILVILGWSKTMPLGAPQYCVASIWVIAPTALTAAWTKR